MIATNEFKLAIFLACGILCGCSNTTEGLTKDAKADSQMASKSASDAVESATIKGRDATASMSLTPAVKLAIGGEPSLNDPANQINVDSDDKQVKLTGHVKSPELKSKAQELAQKILTDHEAHQTLVNELTVVQPDATAK